MLVEEEETRWCSGMRSAGVRALAPEEREAVAAVRTGHARRVLASAGALPAWMVASVLSIWLAPESAFGAVVLCGGGLFVAPAALLFGTESILAWRALSRDLGSPCVETFVGTPLRRLVQDAAVRAFLRRGPISRLEVLAGSGLAWRVDGEHTRSLRPVRVVTVAHAHDAGTRDRRALSEREHRELRARAAREGRVPLVAWYLGAIATVWALVIAIQGADAARAEGWRPLLALVLGAIAVVQAMARRRNAERLRRDDAVGVVTRMRVGGADVELLPKSGMVWTENGAAAPHRTY